MENRQQSHCLTLMHWREIRLKKNAYRSTCRILRCLFESPLRNYSKRIWQQPKQKYSTAPWFVEEASRLLVHSKQSCLSTIAPMTPLFEVSTPGGSSNVILDVLFSQSPLSTVQHLQNDFCKFHENQFFIYLFKTGFVDIRSSNTGELFQRIHLVSKIGPNVKLKWKELSWNVNQESFTIGSTKDSKSNNTKGIVKNLLNFSVYPLQILHHLEIHREIFGSDVVDAEISSDLLLIMHANKHIVNIYSMKHLISEQYSQFRKIYLGQRDPVSGCVVGTHPDGIPVNVTVHTRPPCLFHTSSHQHHLEMAICGIDDASLLTLTCPLKAPFQFCISEWHSFPSGNEKVIDGGTFEDNNVMAIQPHRLFTHPDDSSRLIYVTGAKVVVYEVRESQSGTAKKMKKKKWIEEQFQCDTQKLTPSKPSNEHDRENIVKISCQGRKRKKRQLYGSPALFDLENDGDGTTVVAVSYSPEMELLALLVSNGDETSNDRVLFYDNINGKFVKSVELPTQFHCHSHSDEMDQFVGINFDTIVHCRRDTERHSSRWSCAIFNNSFNFHAV